MIARMHACRLSGAYLFFFGSSTGDKSENLNVKWITYTTVNVGNLRFPQCADNILEDYLCVLRDNTMQAV